MAITGNNTAMSNAINHSKFDYTTTRCCEDSTFPHTAENKTYPENESHAEGIVLHSNKGLEMSGVTTFLGIQADLGVTFFLIAFPCVAMILLGNIVILIILTIRRKRYGPKGVHLTNIASASILISLSLVLRCVDFALTHYGKDHPDWYRTPDYLCRITGYLTHFGHRGLVIFTLLMTFDRFRYFKKPLRGFGCSSTKVVVYSALTWLVAAILVLVPLISVGYFTRDPYKNAPVCHYLYIIMAKIQGWEYYFCLEYIVDFLLIIAMVVFGVVATVHSHKQERRFASHRRSRALAIYKATIMMTSAIVIIYCCQWIPGGS